MTKAIVPAAYGQQPMPTRHDARFQEIVTFGAHTAERWMASPGPLSLPEYLEALQYNLPGSTRQPVLDGFLMRIEQHFRAVPLPAPASSLPVEIDDTATPPAAALPDGPAPESMATSAEGVCHG
ncbi:hypothetical protein SAMN04244579_04323 [Azotobacter beijerinckii]|uniref:Uncharacterized protein n=1 Tax=Azotobacter beijerinckii TaxID=170623 RepID=A0A1H6YSW1_9GAMM|nr:hypothetical protein [Azotobacter beijerinckii]SEJ42894.1 hypothetical protein SAMN04244579_04323 [Azotobacter beijerinckii]